LHGQLVTVIRVRRGPDPDLIIRFPDGFFGAISASWTDYAAGSDSDLSPAPPPLLDPFGLCQISRFIAQLRERHQTDDPRYAEDSRSYPSSN